MGKHLGWMGAPKLFYEGMKKHIKGCARMKINGARPLARPAKFPMASAPFGILLLEFVEWKKRNFLHMQDAFTRFSVIKYFGHDDDVESLLPAKRVCENVLNNWISYFWHTEYNIQRSGFEICR